MSQQTLLVGLAHPDDEVGVAGTILAQRARGDRVVIVWLTRGEMTEAFGPRSTDEVARLRTEQAGEAGAILDVETRLLDFADTRLEATHDAAARVARVIADIRPDGLLTWGDAWTRGRRHPDHQACGRVFRDAITLARIAKTVHPAQPHRAAVPVWTLRDVHSALPVAVVDVDPTLTLSTSLAAFTCSASALVIPAGSRSISAARVLHSACGTRKCSTPTRRSQARCPRCSPPGCSAARSPTRNAPAKGETALGSSPLDPARCVPDHARWYICR